MTLNIDNIIQIEGVWIISKANNRYKLFLEKYTHGGPCTTQYVINGQWNGMYYRNIVFWVLVAILTNCLGSHSSLNFNLPEKGEMPTNPVSRTTSSLVRFIVLRFRCNAYIVDEWEKGKTIISDILWWYMRITHIYIYIVCMRVCTYKRYKEVKKRKISFSVGNWKQEKRQ